MYSFSLDMSILHVYIYILTPTGFKVSNYIYDNSRCDDISESDIPEVAVEVNTDDSDMGADNQLE